MCTYIYNIYIYMPLMYVYVLYNFLPLLDVGWVAV